MTHQELSGLYFSLSGFGLGAICSGITVYILFRYFLSSYLTKKGENLATKEDIEEITHKVEEVKLQYSLLTESLKAKHQLRLGALEKRLEVHQTAFVLWRNLYGSIHSENIGSSVIKCQEFWEQNCVYLEPNVREAFVAAYSCASSHNGLLQSGLDNQAIKENWQQIISFPNILLKSVELPSLTEIENKSLGISKEKS